MRKLKHDVIAYRVNRWDFLKDGTIRIDRVFRQHCGEAVFASRFYWKPGKGQKPDKWTVYMETWAPGLRKETFRMESDSLKKLLERQHGLAIDIAARLGYRSRKPGKETQ